MCLTRCKIVFMTPVKVTVTVQKRHYPFFTKGLGYLCTSVSSLMALGRVLGKSNNREFRWHSVLGFCVCVCFLHVHKMPQHSQQLNLGLCMNYSWYLIGIFNMFMSHPPYGTRNKTKNNQLQYGWYNRIRKKEGQLLPTASTDEHTSAVTEYQLGL